MNLSLLNIKVTRVVKGLPFYLFTLLPLFISCDNYLDVLPDDRAELNSEANITELLTNAYPLTSYFMVAELYSDNTDHCIGSKSYTAFNNSGTTLHEEASNWQDIHDKNQDSPYQIWESCYKSIAAANNVLIAIDKLGNPDRLKAQRGEALLCRAYSHFVLGNIFCMPYIDHRPHGAPTQRATRYLGL